MIVLKVVSYKELKEMTKKEDVIMSDVRELMVRGGKSKSSIYIRLSVEHGERLRIWRSIDGIGLWISINFGFTNSHSIFINRGYVTFLIEK